MRSGIITEIHARTGMFIVSNPASGDNWVFELLEHGPIELDALVIGDLDRLGAVDIEIDGRVTSVFGQSGPSSLAACRRLLR